MDARMLIDHNRIPEIRIYAANEKRLPNECQYRTLIGPKELSRVDDNETASIKHAYNMRTMNLMNFPANASSNKISYRTVMARSKSGVTTNVAKSLEILRSALQNSINKEINGIIQKYIETFFRPSVENIKSNFGNNSVTDGNIQLICRQILDECKKMYFGSLAPSRSNSPLNIDFENVSDNDNSSIASSNNLRKRGHQVFIDSDSESNSMNTLLKPSTVKRKKLKPPKAKVAGKIAGKMTGSNGVENVKREGPKWNSNRLSVETKFVLGSKANKAIGFGATRGRLYTKHADLFRYIGDQEDRQWLNEHGYMPPAGGKAYLLIKEDIEDLLKTDEYRTSTACNANAMGQGFSVPQNMIDKMKKIMDALCTDRDKRDENDVKKTPEPVDDDDDEQILPEIDDQPDALDLSRPVTPCDELDYHALSIPSSNVSPFSLTGNSLSPQNSDRQEASPLTSDLSNSNNDILL